MIARRTPLVRGRHKKNAEAWHVSRASALLCLRVLLPWTALVSVAGAFAPARGPGSWTIEKEDPTAIVRPPEVDPYTQGERELMDAAGIVSFGPFPWAEDQTTLTIEELLGGIPILWAETEHFRIGSSLIEYESEDRDERKLLKDEFARLREKLPEVPRRVRKIDPWLRLHLYAQRLEELYDTFEDRLGLSEADFASLKPGDPMGDGPYLGMAEKYTVLLFQRKSSWGRYAGRYLGVDGETPRRFNFTARGTLFYGTCKELYYGSYDHDLALYCAVAFGVAQNFVDGLCSYRHDTPLWLSVGTGHWFSREIDEHWTTAVGEPGAMRLDPDASNWQPKVRALVDNGYFTKTDELFEWKQPSDMNMIKNRFAWSRVDFLLRDQETARGFFMSFATPFPDKERPVPFERLQKRQTEALAAIDLDPSSFDERWEAWVLKTYKRR